MKTQRSINLLTVLALSFFGAACSDSDSTGPDAGTASVSLSFSVPQAQAQASIGGPQGAMDQSDAFGNTLTLTSVQMVIREIELKREFELCDDNLDDACEEFEVGPFLADMVLEGTGPLLSTPFSIAIPDGRYDEIEFDIHMPTDGAVEDNDFLFDNPTFDGVSIRAEGTYNGVSFVFLQDLNEHQERAFFPVLEIGGPNGVTGPINVTLSIDVATWFVNTDGSLIDPVSANKGNQLEGLVEENIKNSIDAFEDNDRDGVDDDGSIG